MKNNKTQQDVFNPNPHVISLKGKAYLPALPRVAWMRSEHPNWRIHTEIVEWNQEQKWCVIRATIYAENGVPIATAIKSQSSTKFLDYLEKAETGAIARAVALAGYGTLLAADMKEMRDNSEDIDTNKDANSQDYPSVEKCPYCNSTNQFHKKGCPNSESIKNEGPKKSLDDNSRDVLIH